MILFVFKVSESPSVDLAPLTFLGVGVFCFVSLCFKKRCVSGPQSSSVSYLIPSVIWTKEQSPGLLSNLRVKPLTLTATMAAGKMVPAGVSLMMGQGGDGKRE